MQVYENRDDHLNNNLVLQEIPILHLFPILLQNKQKPITNSCTNNLWSKPILILSKPEIQNFEEEAWWRKDSGFIQITETRMR